MCILILRMAIEKSILRMAIEEPTRR